MDFNKDSPKETLDRITLLLDKYWACLTTVEEERELKVFFQKEPVPAPLKDVAQLFRFYNQQEGETLIEEGFEEKVWGQIQANTGQPVRKSNRLISLLQYYGRAAAIVIGVLISAYFVKEEYERSQIQAALLEDTFEDPEKAFSETKKALMLLSKNLNKGKKEVEKIAIFNVAEEKIKSKKKKFKDL